jgi:excisionase family DNA binding protein
LYVKRTITPPARQTLLTPDDVAGVLGVSRDYVLKTLVYQRRIEFIKVGGFVRFAPEAIDKLIAANTTEAAP